MIMYTHRVLRVPVYAPLERDTRVVQSEGVGEAHGVQPTNGDLHCNSFLALLGYGNKAV